MDFIIEKLSESHHDGRFPVYKKHKEGGGGTGGGLLKKTINKTTSDFTAEDNVFKCNVAHGLTSSNNIVEVKVYNTSNKSVSNTYEATTNSSLSLYIVDNENVKIEIYYY